jgi:lysophospholipase L1-like esterase
MENNLILRTLTSPYGDNTRGSVLDHEDVDNNFIYLKGNLIKSGTTQNNNLLLQSINGEIVTIPLSFTGTTSGGTGGVGITALTFDTNNTIIIRDATGGTFTALVNYLSGLTITGSVMNGTAIIATGTFAHAEGSGSTAIGNYSHAEGSSTTASGVSSHAEGVSTISSGFGAHAEGLGTYAIGNYQHVQGTFNTLNNSLPLMIIGNGTSNSSRSDLVLFYSTGVTFNQPVSATTYYGDGSNLTNTTLAANGLSLSSNSKTVVLGQNVGQVGNPAALTSSREIPMSSFTINYNDTLGNSNVFGAGTLTSTRVSGSNIITSNSTSVNSGGISLLATNTLTFGTFSNVTAFNTPILATKRYNTTTSGSTITTTVSNRQGVFFGQIQFENDVAANNNPITQSGGNPISVYSAKIDLWPAAGGQIKTITGALCGYSTYLDLQSANSSSIGNYMDFEAGSATGNISLPSTITNRYGFKVRDLNTNGLVSTNRWAFYQEGVSDKNFFNGFVGIGVSSPQAKLHISAGTTTVPPIIINSGVTTTIPIDGAIEYNNENFYGTIGTTRYPLINQITGVTFSSNTLTLLKNSGGTLSTTINNFTGLTVNGVVSATTYYGDGSNLTNIPSITTLEGVLYDKTSWSNLTDFSTRGTTPIVSSGKIIFSGGTNDLTKTIDLSATTRERYLMHLEYQVGPISSTSDGLGIGTRSISPNATFGIVAILVVNNTGNAGKVLILDQFNSSVITTSTNSLSFSANDTVVLELERKRDTFIATSWNKSTSGTPVSVSYTYSLNEGPAHVLPNTGTFSVYNFGGVQSMTALKITSREAKKSRLIVIGDSKSVGYYAGIGGRFGSLLGNSFQPTNVHAGAADTLHELIAAKNEIISLAPVNVTLSIGSNDIGYGDSVATTFANYQTYVSALINAGINVFHLLPFYQTTIGGELDDLAALIVSNYPSSNVIDCRTPMKQCPSCYLASDNVHPNASGNALIYNTILNSGKLSLYYSTSSVSNLDDVLNAGNSSNLGVNLTAYNTVDSQLKVGSLEIQPFSFNGNAISDNGYYNGSNNVRRSTGYASRLILQNGCASLSTSSASTGGSVIDYKTSLFTDSLGNIGIGGGINASLPNFSSATLNIEATTGRINLKNYGAGSYSGGPNYTLGVTSSGNIVEFQKIKFTQTTTAAIIANDNELSLISGGTGTLVIPANYMTLGKTFRVTLRGKYSTDLVNPAQMNWRIKLGSTTIAQTGNSGLGTNTIDANYQITADFTCRSIGTGGTVMAQGMFFTETGPGANGMDNGFAVATVNTTIANTFDLTVDFNDGSAGNSCYAYILIFEEV